MAASTTRPRVFLDIQIGTEPAGRLVIELFVDKTPKTCENFRALCTGELGRDLSYSGAPFHRIIEDFMVQGGDITKGNGTGGKSIYGKEFEDENIGWRKIDKEGLVCMANRGKSTNTSQFFITLAPCEHLNAKHTVFGHVVSGQQVLDKMVKLKVDKNDRPHEDVLIVHCGELERRKKPGQPSVKGRSKERVPQRSPSIDEGRRGRKRRRQDSDADERHSYALRNHPPHVKERQHNTPLAHPFATLLHAIRAHHAIVREAAPLPFLAHRHSGGVTVTAHTRVPVLPSGIVTTIIAIVDPVGMLGTTTNALKTLTATTKSVAPMKIGFAARRKRGMEDRPGTRALSRRTNATEGVVGTTLAAETIGIGR
ncbi:hypothetical protein GP486_006817 [Trichoglossum hirsutum]|uniref:peptidylprolyl isomerase n=1 Tax=Trichoglossum hirsutum TaxID=265104 RepID=A0A9P8L7Q9_9PEZI|nr:hypothetical protein GP486_006817 [Trichoglossum hirsutum]